MNSAPQLPSFHGQLAVVYDDYMMTLGGGERSALAYALALQNLGFTVEILSRNAVPSTDEIEKVFGSEFASIRLRQIPNTSIFDYLKPAGLRVFVNHTFMSFERNPAAIGIYSQMFPVTEITKSTHPDETDNLASYNLMLSNSSFTKRYTDGMWSFPIDRNHVLHPPIGAGHLQLADQHGGTLPKKEKYFVNIGRFNPGTHNKNQKIIIEAFLAARDRFSSLADWKLILIGNANEDSESRAYHKDCVSLAKDSKGSVEIHANLPANVLSKWLTEAFCYVHATGAFTLPGADPFKCEHFGLSIIEGMAHGCIPLVYARGGIFDILEPGKMGIPYITPTGLVEGMGEISDLYGTDQAAQMNTDNIEAAQVCSQANFTESLAGHISQQIRASS